LSNKTAQEKIRELVNSLKCPNCKKAVELKCDCHCLSHLDLVISEAILALLPELICEKKVQREIVKCALANVFQDIVTDNESLKVAKAIKNGDIWIN